MAHLRLPGGAELRLEVTRHRGAAAVVALLEGGRVMLIRQLRYAAGNRHLYEVPAGVLEPGEPPEACAARELEEEAGLVAEGLEPLGEILTTPGFADERIHLFLARRVRPGALRRDADEVIRRAPLPFAEALAMVERGEIVDAKTVCALTKAALRLGRG